MQARAQTAHAPGALMTAIVTLERTPLAPEHLLQLLVIRNWLAIGIIEEARREFNSLPEHAQTHPEADEIRRELFVS